MSDSELLDIVGPESTLYERYRARAFAALSTDADVKAAQQDWAAFLTHSHGAVFDEMAVENPRERLFVETLYYDFVIDRAIESLQRDLAVSILNREATANTDALSVSFGELHERILGADTLDREVTAQLDTTALIQSDLAAIRELYEGIISREIRTQLGQYYTPRGVADMAVSELAVDDYRAARFLDPGCGSGVFLAACIDAKRDALGAASDPATLVETITNTVFGIDLNPVAVKSAKLSYLLALAPLLDASDIDRLELPVFLTDALGLTRDDEIRFRGQPLSLTVDHLVGNPPWITWGDLPETVRDAWREQYMDDLNLFPQEGIESRLGHGNDDISVPFVWVCIHRYLDGGDASFVLKRDIMNGPAGRLLRTQQVGSDPVAVTHIHDFNQLQPFETATVQAAIYTLAAGREPGDSIPADSWTRGGCSPDYSSGEAIHETLEREHTGMAPIDDDPASSWVRADVSTRALGDCHHEIRHGVKDDAKDVFSIDRARLSELEHDHVYPYIRSKHVVKYGLFGHDLQLVPLRKANVDNEAELRANSPNTHAYLSANRERLESRASSWLQKGTFYNLFGLGEYTWAAYKVVWCRLGFKPHFAVVSTRQDEDLGEKTVIPGDHCMFIATDDRHEAHFLCGLLNSAPYQQSLREVTSQGKASLSKAAVSKLYLPEYDGNPTAQRLAELSMAAHEVVPEHTDVSKRTYNQTTIPELEALQAEMDDCVGRLRQD